MRSRTWLVPLGALALTAGSIAVAQPSTAATAPVRHGGAFVPGGLYHAAPGDHGAQDFRVGNRIINYSTNWSGYAVTGSTFTTATASWVQNAGTCTSGDGQTDMSPWVGLDGFSSNTVEQTGTSVDCNGASADYYAWYEMYPANVVVINKTVRAGDKFTATVTHTSGTSYTLTLKDLTRGWTNTVTKKISGAQDSSAEAVMEMAANHLTKFGTDPFTSFTVDGKPVGSYTSSPYTIEQMEIQVNNTLCDSTSSLSGQENFTTTWLNAC